MKSRNDIFCEVTSDVYAAVGTMKGAIDREVVNHLSHDLRDNNVIEELIKLTSDIFRAFELNIK